MEDTSSGQTSMIPTRTLHLRIRGTWPSFPLTRPFFLKMMTVALGVVGARAMPAHMPTHKAASVFHLLLEVEAYRNWVHGNGRGDSQRPPKDTAQSGLWTQLSHGGRA